MTNFVEKVAGVVQHAKTNVNEMKTNAHDLAKVTKSKGEEKLNIPCVDLTIKVL